MNIFFLGGPKGTIPVSVQFVKLNNDQVYNLSFGNQNKNGTINDQLINDNKDRNKILRTVVGIIYDFTFLNPDAIIFFCGSTPQRTRLYRMVLTIYLDQIKRDFYISGLFKSGEDLASMSFQKGIDYFGFIVQRKKLNLEYEKD